MAESGHVKNVESLGTARDFAVSWGARYQPSNPNLARSCQRFRTMAKGVNIFPFPFRTR